MQETPEDTLLPFDEGIAAYRSKLHHSSNPYPESDWRHDEWWQGWNDQAECDSHDAFDWTIDSFK